MATAPLPNANMRKAALSLVKHFGWRGAWHLSRALVEALSTRATERCLDDGEALRAVDEDFRAALSKIDAIADRTGCRAEKGALHTSNVLTLPLARKTGAS